METSLRFYETLIFVLNWILPPLMMAATAGLVIWKVRKEHYGEKISLEPSPEERKLRELAEQLALHLVLLVENHSFSSYYYLIH